MIFYFNSLIQIWKKKILKNIAISFRYPAELYCEFSFKR